MCIAFYGIKNDTSRSGFEARLPCDGNVLLGPVSALHTYITRTEAHRPSPEALVFITLQPPFRALRKSTIANIMEEAIRGAGLGNQGNSANSFHPTGATAAIDFGRNPDIVMKTCRWETASVFRDHYVHLQPPTDYTHDVCSTTDSSDNTGTLYLGNRLGFILIMCSVT